ncbi:MAG: DUF5074 domain-containing protein [Rikenellaceae bacterium]
MKKIFSYLLLAAMAMTITSCEETTTVTPDGSDTSAENNTGISGVFVLNYGSWGSNDSSLSFNDGESTTNNLFYSANGRLLGSGANDMVVYGEKIFISVSTSDVIYVTDLEGDMITSISNSEYKTPRNVIEHDGKIYATYYFSNDASVATGGVAMIDPVSYTVTSAAAGQNPEGLAVAYGKLYVANSGYGYGTTLSVYDPSTLAYEKDVDVAANPNWLEASEDGSALYLITLGNYYDVPAMLHSIASDGTVTDLSSPEGMSPGEMALGADGELQVLCGVYDKDWNYSGDIYTYNASTGALVGKFITDKTTLADPYKISASTSTGQVALLTSPSESEGSAIIFDAAGKKENSFDVGLSPIKACFVE